MTFLVGDNTAYVNESATYAVDDLIYATGGYVVASSGTPSLCFLRINTTLGWDNTTAAKVRVHNSSGTLLGTATFTAAQGSGWISSAITTGALTAGATIYLAVICTGTADLRLYNSGNTFECQHLATGNYTTPPASITPGSDPASAKPKFNVYLDGTLAGGGGTLLLRPRGMGGGIQGLPGGMNSKPSWARNNRIFVPANYQRRETSRNTEWRSSP